MKKYRIILEIESDEECDVETLLEGSWLFDDMFNGCIIKQKLEKLK